jgi:hypothetical protein
MFADEGAFCKFGAHRGLGEVDPERGHVRTQSVVRLDCRSHLLWILRPYTVIHILTIVAEGQP